MTVEKTFQGMYRISTIYKSCLVTQLYMGYSKRESIQLFKQYLASI
jgi:hypothetical protein